MSGPLWTFDDMVAATGGRPVGAAPAAITGISIDSRTLAPGDAFFAITRRQARRPRLRRRGARRGRGDRGRRRGAGCRRSAG